ncbi:MULTISPECIES: M4 family metallopeptidase [Bacillus cereus group]|uniref:M4 family metallopeptidase n=1 Tax=Bacillus cereus group TaxID=86661 RepID=UPI0022E7C38F|nr:MULTISPECIES: M4 family metallopeptidase [unclassified Bacillus cereus group]MDA2663642.1 M4 family metallopeptidase [Bacillus cereus group sp. Bc032]MDA2674386.1 M4 family metallopeptidase [Bacillus cereus group sp. Bc031]MDA2679711.1 M4 family metallopeptidase [Bacillus cereus group sp. Bc029]MDA2685324.1 M4 family metallopeptidase [Bacillus cereus group sp. Bc030]MDA2740695.1 M4 family metallopeptidase [Bacillus cereus group sp. Bc011]
MKNKKEIAIVALTTGLALTSIVPYEKGYAEETDQMQVDIQEDSFRTGELTKPSQKKPENVVKDALKEKTEHALSPKQVSGDKGVDYKVLQKRGSYDGTTLVRMQQIYEGKEVYGHQLTAHVDKKGIIKSVSGESAQNLEKEDLKNPINLSKEEAKQYIYTKYGNDIQFISEAEVKEVIFVDENRGQATNAYQVTFAAATPNYVSGTYLVDAHSGDMLKNMVQESDLKVNEERVEAIQESKKSNFKSLTGTGKDDLGITRTFGISEQSNGKYALADYTRGQGIETYDVNYRDITFEEKYYPGILTTSTSTTFNDPKAVSAHFLATNVYDFYKDKYKRNSFDNKGKKVVSVVHAWDSGETSDPKNWGNAFSANINNVSMLIYGDPMVRSFDIAGHEFTHAVTSSESNLEFFGESGAINEALSDIMGTAIEKYINNGEFNWTIGEQSGSVLRNMKNPSSVKFFNGVPYPDDYSKYSDLNGEDNEGVHFNSSIINKVAYLIAQGGTHNGVTVNGIGEDKMFDIFYYANTDELNMTSNFSELRLACLKVATNKYGANSIEVETVQKAFDAAKIKGTVKENEKTEANQVPELTVPPTITLRVGDKFDPMSNIKAIDKEDGDLTNRVEHKGDVDTSKPGKYIVDYSVVDSQGGKATVTQTVIVERDGETSDLKPTLTVPIATTITVGESFDPMAKVKAIDKEDGDLTSKVKVEGEVDTSKVGTYIVTYTVTNSKGHEEIAKQTVTVTGREEVKNDIPILKVPSTTTITKGDEFNPMVGVSATDKEDGDLTSKVVYKDIGDTTKVGTFEIIYSVTDSVGNKVHAIQKVLVKDTDASKAKGSTNNSNNGNIQNNSNSDKKESTYKELPNTGGSTTNSTTMGLWMVFAGIVFTLVRKFRKI